MHQILNSTEARSKVRYIVRKLSQDVVECFVPGAKKKASNRVVPIHDNRKWLRETTNERKTSTIIPNTINGRRLLKATTMKEEESKPVYGNTKSIFMISGQNIENSVCSTHPHDPALGRSKVFVKPMEFSLDYSPDHPSSNANLIKKQDTCSKIQVKIGKNITHKGSEIYTENNLDEINDQGLAQNSSRNSSDGTDEKIFEPSSSKSSNDLCHDFKGQEFNLNSLLCSFDNSIIKSVTIQSKKSIMAVNRFPKIKHQSISIESSSQKLENPTCFQSTQEDSSGTKDVMLRKKHSNEQQYDDPPRSLDTEVYVENNQKRYSSLSVEKKLRKESENEGTLSNGNRISEVSTISYNIESENTIEGQHENNVLPSSAENISSINSLARHGIEADTSDVKSSSLYINVEPKSIKSSNEAKGPEVNLGSLMDSFDQSIAKRLLSHSKKSIIEINRYQNARHQFSPITSSSHISKKNSMRHQETRVYCSEKEDEELITKSEKDKSYLKTEKEDHYRLNRSYTFPSLEKMNHSSSIESESSDKSNIKEAPGSFSGPKTNTNFSQQQNELNAILLETGGFEINKMESCHDPIENCIDFNRFGIDVNSEKNHFQNKPLFSVYGMSRGC